MSEKITPVRVGLRISPSLKAFYEKMASEAGASVSSTMALVLKMYADGIQVMGSQNEVKKLLDEAVKLNFKLDKADK